MEKQTKPKPLGPSMAKVILVVAIIVFLGALLGVAGYLAKNKPVKPSQTTPTLTPTLAPDETANWKTYKNEKYGYEVKYSVGSSFVESSSGIEGAGDKGYIADFSIEKDFGIRITARKNIRGDKTLDKLIETRNNVSVVSVPEYAEKIQIDGKPAFKWVTYLKEPGSKRIGAISLAFNGDNYYYIIQTGNQYAPEFTADKEKIYNLFISSFKFIGLKDETADWKTYRNEEYGFEMKYPQNWRVYSEEFESSGTKIENIVFAITNEITLSIYRATKMSNTAITQGNFEEVVNSYRKAYKAGHSEELKEEQIILDDCPGIKMSMIEQIPFGETRKVINILLEKNNEVWRLFFSINEYDRSKENEHLLIFNQILSTFKFIEKDEAVN